VEQIVEVQEWQQIRRLHGDGMPIKAIARHLGVARNTVRKALAMDDPPGSRRQRGSAIDPFEPHIRALITEDPRITATEIAARIGWDRSMTVLKDRVRSVRASATTPAPGTAGRAQLPPPTPESFVGRRAEVTAVREALAVSRQVTLVGPGGVGKSRLAVEVAGRVRGNFPNGVYSFDLSALDAPGRVARWVADRLGLGDGDAQQALADFFRPRGALLLFETCERAVDACGELIDALLRAAPLVHVLATSRTALGRPAERVLPVHPLPAGDLPGARAGVPGALVLFAERAASASPGFAVTPGNVADVRRVCDRLDGLPMAIELACARLRVLSVAELADELEADADVLAGDPRTVPARQRSTRASAAWSAALCTPDERRFWARASVFPSDFDIAAAREVCCDDELPDAVLLDVIAGLVARSVLVRERRSGRARFRLLNADRLYGRARLEPRRLAALRERHRACYARLLADAVAGWAGAGQVGHSDRLRAETANLRAAVRTAVAGPPPHALDMVGRPWFLWASALSLDEYGRWLGWAREAGGPPGPARCLAESSAALVATLQGDHDRADELLADAARSLDGARDGPLPGYLHHVRGLAHLHRGALDDAETELRRALCSYDEHRAPDLALVPLLLMGFRAAAAGDPGSAAAHLDRVDAACARSGEVWLRCYAGYGLGLVALALGDAGTAERRAVESLRGIRRFDDALGFGLILELLAWCAASGGDGERAAALFGASSSAWAGERIALPAPLSVQRARFERVARADVGRADFAAQYALGKGLDRPGAVRMALREPVERPDTAANPGRTLTRRELEIATLVARGLSNREIGEHLTISFRTVEGHVGHVLTKLRLVRRSQIAPWLHEHSRDGRPSDR
jgi:predicted ATPase/DNA-binding CsgD family transcriptional regulator